MAGHNVRECLADGNLHVMNAFVERVIRGCEYAEPQAVDIPEETMIGECLWEHCAELAATCHENPTCVALEVCFQDCFGRELGNCVRRCLEEVPNADEGRGPHEALVDCGRPRGCYR